MNHRNVELCGECFLSLSRIMNGEFEFVVHNGELMQKRTRLIKERLWHYGRHIGNIEIQIDFLNKPYYKQMLFGIMTDSGVKRYFPSSLSQTIENNDNQIYCLELKKKKEKMMEEVFRLSQGSYETENQLKIVGQTLQDIQEFLESFSIDKQIKFKNIDDLQNNQIILLEILEHFSHLVEEVNLLYNK
jgi:hypothetical protein